MLKSTAIHTDSSNIYPIGRDRKEKATTTKSILSTSRQEETTATTSILAGTAPASATISGVDNRTFSHDENNHVATDIESTQAKTIFDDPKSRIGVQCPSKLKDDGITNTISSESSISLPLSFRSSQISFKNPNRKQRHGS